MADLIDIVSSKVKAEIFRLLFGLSEAELHLRDLARQSGLALGTIQKEVKHLCSVGLISARRNGNRVYYKANSQHPAHGDLRSLVLKTNGLAGTLGEALRGNDILISFIFGSIAKGEANAASDIDLIVIGNLGLRKLTGLISGIGNRVGREINPHVFLPEEFRLRQKSGDHFLKTVVASPKIFVKGSESELAAMVK